MQQQDNSQSLYEDQQNNNSNQQQQQSSYGQYRNKSKGYVKNNYKKYSQQQDEKHNQSGAQNQQDFQLDQQQQLDDQQQDQYRSDQSLSNYNRNQDHFQAKFKNLPFIILPYSKQDRQKEKSLRPKLGIKRLTDDRKIASIEIDIPVYQMSAQNNLNIINNNANNIQQNINNPQCYTFIRDKFDWDLSKDKISTLDFAKQLVASLNLPSQYIEKIRQQILSQIMEHIKNNTKQIIINNQNTQNNNQALLNSQQEKQRQLMEQKNLLRFNFGNTYNQLQQEDLGQRDHEKKKMSRMRRNQMKKSNNNSSINNFTPSQNKYFRQKKVCRNCKNQNITPGFQCKNCKLPFELLQILNFDDRRVKLSAKYYEKIANKIPLLVYQAKKRHFDKEDFDSFYGIYKKIKYIFEKCDELSNQNLNQVKYIMQKYHEYFLNGHIQFNDEQLIYQNKKGDKQQQKGPRRPRGRPRKVKIIMDGLLFGGSQQQAQQQEEEQKQADKQQKDIDNQNQQKSNQNQDSNSEIRMRRQHQRKNKRSYLKQNEQEQQDLQNKLQDKNSPSDSSDKDKSKTKLKKLKKYNSQIEPSQKQKQDQKQKINSSDNSNHQESDQSDSSSKLSSSQDDSSDSLSSSSDQQSSFSSDLQSDKKQKKNHAPTGRYELQRLNTGINGNIRKNNNGVSQSNHQQTINQMIKNRKNDPQHRKRYAHLYNRKKKIKKNENANKEDNTNKVSENQNSQINDNNDQKDSNQKNIKQKQKEKQKQKQKLINSTNTRLKKGVKGGIKKKKNSQSQQDDENQQNYDLQNQESDFYGNKKGNVRQLRERTSKVSYNLQSYGQVQARHTQNRQVRQSRQGLRKNPRRNKGINQNYKDIQDDDQSYEE